MAQAYSHETDDAVFAYLKQRYAEIGMSSICTLGQYMEAPDAYERSLETYRKLAAAGRPVRQLDN